MEQLTSKIYSLMETSSDNNTPTMSGRELHELLEIKTPYRKWFPRMCKYCLFVEGKDYITLGGQIRATQNPKNPTTIITDHLLTIEAVKHICIIQRTEKGGQIRKALIRAEEEWNNPVSVMKRAEIMAESVSDKFRQQTLELARDIIRDMNN